MLLLQVVTMFLVAVAMSLALAHALEFPGKMRLEKDIYMATQAIYYPGFTIGGFGEALAVIASLVLTVSMTHETTAFWWSFSGFVALLIMQGIFWIVTQPVNRRWVGAIPMNDVARKFFRVEQKRPADGQHNWQQLRNTWEYSHIARSVFAAISLISTTLAIALYWRS